MPKSTTPKDKDTRKTSPKTRSGKLRGSGVSAGGTQTVDTDKLCMMVFNAATEVADARLETGDILKFLPNPLADNEILLVKNGQNLARYNGVRKSNLLRCMKLGYKYSARVTAIDGEVVSLEVRGEGA